MRVLLTSGPTREPIDDVRFVSNVSTGRLGVEVANALLQAGHHVTFLRGAGSLAPKDHGRLETVEFESAASLVAALETRLRDVEHAPDVLIHAAAVADYAPVKVDGKIKSDHSEMVIRMQPTPKIADRIRAQFPRLPIIMFKLESGISREVLHQRARTTMQRVRAQGIVANLLEEVGASLHRAELLRPDGSIEVFRSREEIARGLAAEVSRVGAAMHSEG